MKIRKYSAEYMYLIVEIVYKAFVIYTKEIKRVAVINLVFWASLVTYIHVLVWNMLHMLAFMDR